MGDDWLLDQQFQLPVHLRDGEVGCTIGSLDRAAWLPGSCLAILKLSSEGAPRFGALSGRVCNRRDAVLRRAVVELLPLNRVEGADVK
jgi:hypothetical protein